MSKHYGFTSYDGFANDIARVVHDIPYLTSEGFTREANSRLNAALFEMASPPHEHDWRWNLAQPGEIICTSSVCGYASRRVRDRMGNFHYMDMPKYTGPVPSV